MSLVTTTRSQRSRMVLHSISTSVVLPEPTGPPTPTRSGGNGRVRRAIWCRGLIVLSSLSGAEQARVLSFVLRREDRQHRHECLHVGGGRSEGGVDDWPDLG